MLQKAVRIDVAGNSITVTVTVTGTTSYGANTALVTVTEVPGGLGVALPAAAGADVAQAEFHSGRLIAGQLYSVKVSCSGTDFGRLVKVGPTNQVRFDMQDDNPVP